jgi:hypothetical protein
MDWLHDLIERINGFFNEKPDNDDQRMRQKLGLQPLSRLEGLRNLMIIIILGFLTMLGVGILGYFEII